jgi:hypothetical protein
MIYNFGWGTEAGVKTRRPRERYKDNINIDFRETNYEERNGNNWLKITFRSGLCS